MSIQNPGVATDPPCTEPLEDHRLFRRDEFWRALPGYFGRDVPFAHISDAKFGNLCGQVNGCTG